MKGRNLVGGSNVLVLLLTLFGSSLGLILSCQLIAIIAVFQVSLIVVFIVRIQERTSNLGSDQKFINHKAKNIFGSRSNFARIL